MRHSPVVFVYLRGESGSYTGSVREYEGILHEWQSRTVAFCECEGFYGGTLHFPYAEVSSMQYSPPEARYAQQQDDRLTAQEDAYHDET